MVKKIILALVVLALGAGVGLFVYKSEPRLNQNFEAEHSFFKGHEFRLGLDLSGGTHLIYEADLSAVAEGEIDNSMEALRDTIERRVNLFGVAEPVVQVQHGSVVSGGGEQLIVDLPGVTDVQKAVEMIGQTPLLEFKTEAPAGTPIKVKANADGQVDLGSIDLTQAQYVSTELTGRYLDRAMLEFEPTTREPIISLQFDEEGAKLFAQITKENAGKTIAIFLDGAPISVPGVGEEYKDTGITGGQAFISGQFTPVEAKQLVGRLNSGALPVPVKLLSTQTIGPILGDSAVQAGVRATIIGFLIVAVLLILWYRLPGLVAAVSLSIFVILMLALFKLIPVTLTAAGVAGFIISIGIAVDANVLVFERMKEEMREGSNIRGATSAGFTRAWDSIRDSNISGLLTAIILFWFGTSLIQGFALTLGIGILTSLFCAITVMQILMRALSFTGEGKVARFFFGSGFTK
ncbi:MAG: protein translocase subunit SecD [bacterium]|nr:protein translocase subunit SecD [bacterium]